MVFFDIFFFKQKTAYEMRISDWSSDVCSSDLEEVDFGESGRKLKIRNIEHFDPAGWDFALFAIGSEATKLYAPKFAAAGCTVIDNSSLYRMDPDVPLIVPEVNPEAIDGYTRRNIIANPNCSTAQMVAAPKPLHDTATIKQIGRASCRE